MIIPALDEERTIGECITKIQKVFHDLAVHGEIIVADSSSDQTGSIAQSLGARVIRPKKSGYGNAYLAGTKRGFINQEDAEWDETYELNLKTRVTMSRAVAPYFIKQRSGKIVNISSVAGKGPRPWLMAYGAAKAADISFTKSLAAELAGDNINVNCICPGIIYTPLWEKLAAHMIDIDPNPEAKGMMPREYFDRFLVPLAPLKREQTAEDIGHAVVFLVSEDAKNITGQSLNVDGGVIMY